ncbi:hypothetical protein EDB84DRAFT_1555023 [Lactarius hengduanensis]|nr:hypothetical protein EDB84DRAFT_1555023 [Lactarius hengduanensis]
MNKDRHPAWRFISVKHWDEYPRGTWTIRVSDTNAKIERDALHRNALPVGGHPSTRTKAYPEHTEHLQAITARLRARRQALIRGFGAVGMVPLLASRRMSSYAGGPCGAIAQRTTVRFLAMTSCSAR